MKVVTSSLLILLTVLVNFQQSLIVMHFKINRDTIEHVYCENKEGSASACHGLCYLKKQLEKTESSDFPAYAYAKMAMLPVEKPDFPLANVWSEIKKEHSREPMLLYNNPSVKKRSKPPIATIYRPAY